MNTVPPSIGRARFVSPKVSELSTLGDIIHWGGGGHYSRGDSIRARFASPTVSELSTLGDIIHWGGGELVFTSEKCPGGQYSLVNSVRGDSIHSYTGTAELAVRARMSRYIPKG